MPATDDMELFACVVESGSFTAAATRMDSSRSLISKRIQRLERRLGVQLLNRTTRRLSLTESGEVYLDYCRSVTNLRREAEQRIGEMGRSPQGRLRVTMPITFGQMHIAPLVPEFLNRYPGITLDVHAEDGFVDLVQAGYDLAIRIGVLEDSGLIARQIATTRLITVASPTYLQAHGVPDHPGELRDRNCLTYRHPRTRGSTWSYEVGGRRTAVAVAGDLRANNGVLLLHAARGGVGITRLPDFMVRESIANGELVELLGGHACEELGIYTVHAQRRASPAKIQALVEFLVEKLGGE